MTAISVTDITPSLGNLAIEVSTLEDKCREALQYDSVSRALREKGKAFDQICALLDFVGDSESALSSVNTHAKRDKVEHYFLAYGLLQLMYTRQVSLKAVLKSLGVPVPNEFKQNSILKPRDCVIGHPVTSDGGAHVIVRNSLSADGFEFVSYYGSETRRGNAVSYELLLVEHLQLIRNGLTLVHNALAEIENERRRKMRMVPLSPMIHGMAYVARCIAAATVEEKYEPAVEAHMSMLEAAMKEIRPGLVARLGEEQTSYHVDGAIEGISMLRELYPFQGKKRALRFEVVANSVEAKVKELIQLARELDESEAKDIS